jgi:hypothetical protein
MNVATSLFKWILRFILLYILLIVFFLIGSIAVAGGMPDTAVSEPELVSATSGLLIIALADLLVIVALILTSRLDGWKLVVSLVLAFWRQRGWPEEEVFPFTGLARAERYRRYAAVIHLVTAADGVPSEYTRWLQAPSLGGAGRGDLARLLAGGCLARAPALYSFAQRRTGLAAKLRESREPGWHKPS